MDVVGYHSWYHNFISALTPRANRRRAPRLPPGRHARGGGYSPRRARCPPTNFGRSRVAGADLGIEYKATPDTSFDGSISYIKLLKFHNSDPTQPTLLLNVPD